MKNLLVLALIGFFSCQIKAQVHWNVKSGEVKFKIKKAGFNVDGKFGGFSSMIDFDPKNPD